MSGDSAEDHLHNLRQLLQRLQDKGLRCRIEKCVFAQPSAEYLGHTLSHQDIAKGSKVDAVINMPRPHDLSSLKLFWGSIQFYSKFLPNLATITEPLYRLTRSSTEWNWEEKQEVAFTTLKEMLSTELVLAHFDPSLRIRIAFDASAVRIGAVLFHLFPDGSERPISNASKTLITAQRKCSQIQKEALSINFGLRKFHQYLYARKFILAIDHQPLLALLSPNKATPALAANRLVR